VLSALLMFVIMAVATDTRAVGAAAAIAIGGGVVLDAAPGRHKRMDPAVVNALAAKERGTPDDLLETWLRGALGRTVDPKAFTALVYHWQNEGKVTTDQTSVRSASFQVELNPRQQALLDRVAEIYRKAGFNVPSLEEASEEAGAPPDAISAMIRVGQDQGLFSKIAEGLYYHCDVVEQAKQIVRDQIAKTGSITVSQFRDITGSSRKYALPVMEYFDAVKFTRRRGDERVLYET
jgi:selenocysteine-specific elongation factor